MAQSADASVNCVFCGILAGDVPASFVYDDELTSAFLDIRPVARGHVQEVDHLHLHVIPRYRLDDLVFDAPAWALPAPERDELMDTASALTAALAEEVDR